MRDGEQSPGASMTHAEKLDLAALLEEMGVDIIEAGFPAASPGDFASVQAIAQAANRSVICGLARATEADIRRCAEAVGPAPQKRIHTFISTSAIHIKHKLRMTPEAVLEHIDASVRFARGFTDDVEWSPEDATRTEFDYLCRAIDVAIRAGATTINVPDTVGYSFPQEYGELIRRLITTVEGGDRVVWSTHCHNDLGLAVANSLAGVMGGARQIECSVNGLGERAGNAALEEVVMALKVRGDGLPFATDIDATRLLRASKMVSQITGFPVQYNKAIVGKNAFAHESGIHQDGMLKNAQTYEIMRPEDVGVSQTSLVMGKHSGRHAFRDKCQALGYELGENALNDAFRRFKDLADRKKHVFDEDIMALLDAQAASAPARVSLVRLRVLAGTDGPQTADIDLLVEGQPRWTSARGNGPVDAVFNAIQALVPHAATLELYQVHAVTEGTDAQAEVSVRLADSSGAVTGRAADPDTLVASARAYIHALNKLQARGQKALAA
jgi:2-isopropylmalate synthase